MRWPWVSREAHDLIVLSQRLRLGDLESDVRRLTDIIVELRREGFQPPARPTDMQPVEADLDDAVLQAIAGRAAGLPEVERELVRYAHSMKGTDPQVVADTIWRGSDYDGEDD